MKKIMMNRAAAMTIDYSVQGSRFFVRAVDWINTNALREMIERMPRGHNLIRNLGL